MAGPTAPTVALVEHEPLLDNHRIPRGHEAFDRRQVTSYAEIRVEPPGPGAHIVDQLLDVDVLVATIRLKQIGDVELIAFPTVETQAQGQRGGATIIPVLFFPFRRRELHTLRDRRRRRSRGAGGGILGRAGRNRARRRRRGRRYGAVRDPLWRREGLTRIDPAADDPLRHVQTPFKAIFDRWDLVQSKKKRQHPRGAKGEPRYVGKSRAHRQPL